MDPLGPRKLTVGKLTEGNILGEKKGPKDKRGLGNRLQGGET